MCAVKLLADIVFVSGTCCTTWCVWSPSLARRRSCRGEASTSPTGCSRTWPPRGGAHPLITCRTCGNSFVSRLYSSLSLPLLIYLFINTKFSMTSSEDFLLYPLFRLLSIRPYFFFAVNIIYPFFFQPSSSTCPTSW